MIEVKMRDCDRIKVFGEDDDIWSSYRREESH